MAINNKEKEVIKEEITQLNAKISQLASKQYSLKNEYSNVINKYKKADERGVVEMPTWAVVLIGTPFYLILLACMLILKDYFEYSSDLVNTIVVLVIVAMALVGLPVLLSLVIHYVFEDMLSDILKIPYRKEYRKYKKESDKINRERQTLIDKRDSLTKKISPQKSHVQNTSKVKPTVSCAGDLINEMARGMTNSSFKAQSAQKSLYYDVRTGKRLYEHNGKKVDENGNEVSSTYWE